MLNSIVPLFSGGAAATAFDSIATVTVGAGGSSTITFSSIPSTYKHLQIRLNALMPNDKLIGMEFNSDSGSNYAWHQLNGDGASATAGAGTSNTYISLLYNYAASGYASTSPTGAVIDILDYANTNKYKTTRSLGGIDYNGAGWVRFQSGLWQSTNAISTIKLSCLGASSFSQNSTFALYGVK